MAGVHRHSPPVPIVNRGIGQKSQSVFDRQRVKTCVKSITERKKTGEYE